VFAFLHGRELALLSERERVAYEDAAFSYWRAHGFPDLEISHREVLRRYDSFASRNRPVFASGRRLNWSGLGLGLANHFHPEMWTTKCEYFRTPMEVFLSDDMLRVGIRRALRLWPDRRPLNPPNMRRMLATFTNTKRVSNFRPTVARALYERFSSAGDTIVDPAAGYGGRLLGALPLARTYIGIEPNPASVRANVAMVKALGERVVARTTLIQACAEDALARLEPASAAFVLLSPPYYRRERYAQSDSQSWVRYPDYERWKAGFLEEVLQKCAACLRPDGHLALNVANTECHPVADDARAIAARLLKYRLTYRMLIGSVPYHRWHRGGFRSEPIYIFRKEG
jgi:SAM-dependent methyltransferase